MLIYGTGLVINIAIMLIIWSILLPLYFMNEKVNECVDNISFDILIVISFIFCILSVAAWLVTIVAGITIYIIIKKEKQHEKTTTTTDTDTTII